MAFFFSDPARVAALALGLALPAAAWAQAGGNAPQPAPQGTASHGSSDKVVARADGAPITEGDLAMAAEDPALSVPGTVGEDQKRDLLVSYMIDLKIGAKAAEAAKIGDNPEFAKRLAYFREKLLLDEYLESEVKKTTTPEAMRKIYDDTAKTMKPEEEVRARHILLENEEDAKKAAARVKGGEDFAKVAGEISKDPGSKTDGGDLGFFSKERMVAPFADAAFKLQLGQISDPVKTQFGWHVIRLEEKRTKPVPTFEEMKDQIEAYLTRKAQQDVILRLRQNAKIERLDEPAKADEKPAAKPADAKEP